MFVFEGDTIYTPIDHKRTRTRRLQRLRGLRRMLVHEYATASAEQIHDSALLLTANFIPFCDAYKRWIKQGFPAKM